MSDEKGAVNEPSMLVTSSSPHIHCGTSVRGTMRDVLTGLIPPCIAAVVFFGLRALALIAVCTAATVITEYVCRKMMNRNNTIGDLSAAVTGVLLALNLPSGLPFWQAALGGVVSIAVAKQIFGGLGFNPFNPALVGRAFLLISFGATMTSWTESDWKRVERVPEAGISAPAEVPQPGYDVVMTTATPLGEVKTAAKRGEKPDFVYDSQMRWKLFIGDRNGSMGETSVLAVLIGALWLLYRRVITWHIPVFYIGTVAVFALCLRLAVPDMAMPVDFHILSGGLMLGACFMATDMVTNPVTRQGQVIFAIGCGILTMIIRCVPGGAYPEGVSFAILIMNAFTPLINKMVRVHRFGEPKRGKAV